jgi:hypothetical protein
MKPEEKDRKKDIDLEDRGTRIDREEKVEKEG